MEYTNINRDGAADERVSELAGGAMPDAALETPAHGPQVSVVVPTYNQPTLLLETLDSVFAQTFGDFEVIVVNDGSTDDTAARLERYARDNAAVAGRMRVITQANGGIGRARDAGIAAARGEFVALLDHDDLWRPGKLAVQVEYLHRHPRCVAVSVPWEISTEPGKPRFDVKRMAMDAENVVLRPVKALADEEVFLCTSSLMFRREAAAGLRHGTQPNAIEDRQFQIGLFTRGAFGIAGEEILLSYRIHPANASSQGQASTKQANFYSNGLSLLREMDAAGAFAGLTGIQRDDLHAFFATLAMQAIHLHLNAGNRGRCIKIALAESGGIRRAGHMHFLLRLPMRLMIPNALRRWRAGRK